MSVQESLTSHRVLKDGIFERQLWSVGACQAGPGTGGNRKKNSNRGTPEHEAGFYRVVEMDRDVCVWVRQGSATVVKSGQVLQKRLALKTTGTPF